jgi:hypothetical protein
VNGFLPGFRYHYPFVTPKERRSPRAPHLRLTMVDSPTFSEILGAVIPTSAVIFGAAQVLSLSKDISTLQDKINSLENKIDNNINSLENKIDANNNSLENKIDKMQTDRTAFEKRMLLMASKTNKRLVDMQVESLNQSQKQRELAATQDILALDFEDFQSAAVRKHRVPVVGEGGHENGSIAKRTKDIANQLAVISDLMEKSKTSTEPKPPRQ